MTGQATSACAEEPAKELFCVAPASSGQSCPCDAQNNYANNTRGTDAFDSPTEYRFRKKTRKDNKAKTKKVISWPLMGLNAHHIIPQSCAIKLKIGDQVYLNHINQVEWCVHDSANILALPVWAHTIKHYADLSAGADVSVDDLYKDDRSAPSFAGLAMHDYDHPSYNDNVDEDVYDTIQSIKVVIEEHDEPNQSFIKKVKDILQDAINELEEEITGRDTHDSWVKGSKEPDSDWYKAFSLSRTPSKKSFPGKDWNQIVKLASDFAEFASL